MNIDETEAYIHDAMKLAQCALDAILNHVTGEIIRGQREGKTLDEMDDGLFALNGAISYLQAALHALCLKKEADRDLATMRSSSHS